MKREYPRVENAVSSFSQKEEKLHIAVIWQRFLPYHIARLKRLKERCEASGHSVTAIEVAARDASYGIENVLSSPFERICCFPETSYHELPASNIHRKVFTILNELHPDIVFSPATPFPEGMAAVAYRLSSGKRVVIMDDAWEHTDRKGIMTKRIKKFIHRNVDAAFVPAPSHVPYYIDLGFSEARIICGVDVVDNEYFMGMAEKICPQGEEIRAKYALPLNYFLFVGRFLPRKGLESLITAYRNYRVREKTAWDLVLVGSGQHREQIETVSGNIPGIHFAGPQFGDNLCMYYSLAHALIVPSVRDPWGLVINEAMAAGLPVLVSRGCGAAKTLVREGENGWTFEPEDTNSLSDLMLRTTLLSPDIRRAMGQKSKEIIALWPLDRFAGGVFEAIKLPPRLPGGCLSDVLTKLWKGHVSIN